MLGVQDSEALKIYIEGDDKLYIDALNDIEMDVL